MKLKTAIQYTNQYRRNGKSCYIRSADRDNVSFWTNVGRLDFVCKKATYAHGGKSKWWRAYLRFAETGKAVPSKLFSCLDFSEA